MILGFCYNKHYAKENFIFCAVKVGKKRLKDDYHDYHEIQPHKNFKNKFLSKFAVFQLQDWTVYNHVPFIVHIQLQIDLPMLYFKSWKIKQLLKNVDIIKIQVIMFIVLSQTKTLNDHLFKKLKMVEIYVMF